MNDAARGAAQRRRRHGNEASDALQETCKDSDKARRHKGKVLEAVPDKDGSDA
jgi:hypothetical protein